MANRQIRNPGELARFDATAPISGDVPSFAINTGQAAEALANAAGGMASTLMKLAQKAAQREGQMEGMTAGQKAGASYLQAQQTGIEAGAVAGTGPWMEQAKAILRHEEGFRETPYHDVNAHRVGYGSDTTVTADGKVVRVTPGMKITRDDAERDLDYRLTKREGLRVQQQLGADWEKLPDNAKGALASVGYNYGSLPAPVVAAARTGDLQQLASAVASLGSNPARRKREAALILAGAAPAPAGVDPIVTGSSGSQKVPAPVEPLSTEPLALRRDGTIRGEAYDDAAIASWGWRMQEGLSNELFAAQQQFDDDPQGFAGAAQQIRDKYSQDLADPQQTEMFDKTFADRSQAYARNITANHEKKLRQEQVGSFAAGLASRQIDLERQAQVLGANPEGDKIIGDQVRTVQASIDGAVAAGTITAAQGEQQKQEIAETAARGRIQGVYDALPTPEAKEQFSLSVLEDWKEQKGPLSALPFATVKSISDTLRRDAREQINAKVAGNKVEAARLSSLIDDDVASVATTGKGVDPDATGLTADRVKAIVGEPGLIKWQEAREHAGKLYDATSGMETQSSDDIAERLELIAPKPGTPGYADNLEVYEAAQKQASAVLKARSQDPAAAVQKSFPSVAALADQVDPQNPASMQSLVTARLQAQKGLDISEFEQQPLTNAEALALSKAVSAQQDPRLASKAMMDLVTQVENTYGPHANQVLSQVLAAQGIDKEMATLGAGYFAKLKRGEQPSTADRRQASVLSETSAAARSGQPRAGGLTGAGDPSRPVTGAARSSTNADFFAMPNYKQMQRLVDHPELAPQFDEKFGPGASTRILGNTGPISYQTPQGIVTVQPDGTQSIEPAQRQ